MSKKLSYVQKGSNKNTYFGNNWYNLSGASPQTLADAPFTQKGSGSFRNDGSLLCDSSGISLKAGLHFQYGKRLDASSTEDSADGFGSTSGGIYDTSNSGDFASGKYLRIIENNSNVKTSYSLKIYAKNLGSSYKGGCPMDRCYIDPLFGTYCLPRPIFWDKCNTVLSASSAELTSGVFSIHSAGGTMSPNTNTVVSGKFNNAVMFGTDGMTVGQNICYRNLQVADTFPPQGCVSYWGFGFGRGTYLDAGVYSDQYFNGGIGKINSYIGSTDRIVVANFSYRVNSYSPFGIFCDTLGGYIQLVVGDTMVQEVVNTATSNTYRHFFVVWDTNKSLTYSGATGHSVVVYIDGVQRLASTATISTNVPLIINQIGVGSTGSIPGTTYITMLGILDNIKIWDSICEDPAFEYNSGVGRENALAPIYSSPSGYVPINEKVGYYYLAPTTAPASLYKPVAAENETILSEPIQDYSLGIGYFGENHAIYNNDYSMLIENVDFYYDEALDGSGTHSIDIYDDSNSGAFDTGKIMRVVHNGTNLTSLGLKPVAKAMPNDNFFPPGGEFYVDPARGKLVTPRPIFWDKCNTPLTTLTPEISTSDYKITESGSTSSRFVSISGVYGNAQYRQLNTLSAGLRNMCKLNILDSFPDKGSLSLYYGIGGYAYGDSSPWYYGTPSSGLCLGEPVLSYGVDLFYFWRLTECYPFGLKFDYTYSQLQLVIGSNVVSSVGDSPSNTLKNFFISWDNSGNLSCGELQNKTIIVWWDGTPILHTSTNFVTTNRSLSIGLRSWMSTYNNAGSYVTYNEFIENIKVWDSPITAQEFITAEASKNSMYEASLHPLYGSSTNYQPSLTTGYYKAGGNVSVQLENATDTSFATGYFGISHQVSDANYLPLVAGESYNYDEALDGSGANEIDIYDDSPSGTFDTGKCLRVVHNGSNLTTLGLKPIAKNLSSLQVPGEGEFYIDPYRGKYSLPSPSYWSKCESYDNIANNPEVRLANCTSSVTNLQYATISYTTGKFGNCMHTCSNTNGAVSIARISPFADFYGYDTGSVSLWYTQYVPGVNSNLSIINSSSCAVGGVPSIAAYSAEVTSMVPFGVAICSLNSEQSLVPGVRLLIGSNIMATVNIQDLFLTTQYLHMFVSWYKSNTVGSSWVKVWVNGNLKINWTGTLPSTSSSALGTYVSGYATGGYTYWGSVDNIKIWNTPIVDTSYISYEASGVAEDSLHSVYGSSANYKPNIQVGYYKASTAGCMVKGVI